jgi:predicted O-methyltransferase YrrM
MQFDPKIQSAIDELDKLGKTRDDAWQIPREEGHLLCQIALVAHAKLIVEVGTSYGFSGLFWASALKLSGGRLHTIDVNPKKFDSSKATFASAGVGDIITNHIGDAGGIIGRISGPIDIGFVDADKPSTQKYFDLLWPKVRVGGMVITDNAKTHRAELADFVKHVRSRPDAHSIEIAIGNGIEWTVKVQ